MEEWRDGSAEDWRDGRLEEWKDGSGEGWKIGFRVCCLNRGKHREHRERGKRGFLLTCVHFSSESRISTENAADADFKSISHWQEEEGFDARQRQA